MKERAVVRGFAAVEWLVAISLMLFLMALSARAVATFVRYGFHELEAAEWKQQSSLAGGILAAELRRGSPPSDWRAHSGDSVTLRAFRGYAWICGGQRPPASKVIVVFRGDRQPNPAKDSVLVYGSEGSAFVLPLRARRSSGISCPSLSSVAAEEWDLGGVVPPEGVLRLFEHGAYSVGNGAFRYRSGLGGRQPVVGGTFDTTSALRGSASGVPGPAVAELLLHASAGPYRARTLGYRRVVFPRRSVP